MSGQSMEHHYGGPPRELSQKCDFYTLNNEDIGFIANLTTSAMVYPFALPYPAYLDLDEETMVVEKIEFHYIASPALSGGITDSAGLVAWISMLDKEFAADWDLQGEDAEDENIKAQLAGPMFFGRSQTCITATQSVEGVARDAPSMCCAVWWPPNKDGLDAFTPIYIQLVNADVSIVLATNVASIATFTTYERVYLRVWFHSRKLTSSELSMRKAYKYLILDA